jgi:hypothetical protein
MQDSLFVSSINQHMDGRNRTSNSTQVAHNGVLRRALALQVERRLRDFGRRSVGFSCTSYSAMSGRVPFTKTTK